MTWKSNFKVTAGFKLSIFHPYVIHESNSIFGFEMEAQAEVLKNEISQQMMNIVEHCQEPHTLIGQSIVHLPYDSYWNCNVNLPLLHIKCFIVIEATFS